MAVLRIATRRSPLAIWQAEHVAERLRAIDSSLEIELVPFTTSGDRLLDAPLAKVGGKGLFVKELELAVLERRADIAVHSMKDVPVELPPPLELNVILSRGDPRDAFVSTKYASLAELPAGARVGTSSLRRHCQLQALRADLDIANLRGGVGTRLRKLDEGEFDAIVLACAGLQRLGLADRIAQPLEAHEMLPAVGQGALGIECRAGDVDVARCIAGLHDPDTGACVNAERAMNRRLGGGCQVPIAGFAELRDSRLHLRALVSSLDASEIIHEEGSTIHAEAQALGETVAHALLARGAERILTAVYNVADRDAFPGDG